MKKFSGQTRKLELVPPLTSFTPVLVIFLISFFDVDNLKTNAYLLPTLATFCDFARLNVRLSSIMIGFANLQDNSSRIKRLDEILSTKDHQIIRKGGLKLNSKINSIILNNVDFLIKK